MQAHQAETIAASLGLQRVGMLFSQSATEKEYIMNDVEIALACSIQAEVGKHCVIAVFTQMEQEGKVRSDPCSPVLVHGCAMLARGSRAATRLILCVRVFERCCIMVSASAACSSRRDALRVCRRRFI